MDKLLVALEEAVVLCRCPSLRTCQESNCCTYYLSAAAVLEGLLSLSRNCSGRVLNRIPFNNGNHQHHRIYDFTRCTSQQLLLAKVVCWLVLWLPPIHDLVGPYIVFPNNKKEGPIIIYMIYNHDFVNQVLHDRPIRDDGQHLQTLIIRHYY